MKWFVWALVPLTTLAGLTLIQNWNTLLEDVYRIVGNASSLTMSLAALVLANGLSRLAQGVVILAKGGKVREFGLMVQFGFVPRFFIDRSSIKKFDRSGQLWCYATPLLLRFACSASAPSAGP